MSKNVHSSDSIRARIASHRLNKSASTDPKSATDEDDKGSATVKEDPAASNANQNVPAAEPTNAPKNDELCKDTKPSPTGENMVVHPKDGDAEDKQLGKLASLRNRVANLQTKSATLATPVVEPKVEGVSKTASTDEIKIDLSQENLLKLAQAIVASSDGVDAVLPILRRQSGREAAAALIKDASAAYAKQLADLEYQAAMVKEANVRDLHIKHLVNTFGEAKVNCMIKAAALHDANTANLDEMKKYAYAQGVSDAQEVGSSPQPEDAQLQGSGEGGATIEQIITLLQQAVESGEITDEEAQALATQLLQEEQKGGDQGAPAPGGDPSADPSAGAAPPADPSAGAPPDMGKSASAVLSLKSEANALFSKLVKA